MKVIKITYPHEYHSSELPETIAAIGFFDGIHKGHQAVISKAVQLAKLENKECAVISFHPHPSVVLNNPAKPVRYITTLSEKEKLLNKMGVDRFYLVTFNQELSQLTPKHFIEHFIIGLNIQHLVAGFDYTFGHKGAGTMEMIDGFSNHTVSTTVIAKMEFDKDKISSTRIRALLKDGYVDQLTPLLGRKYRVNGKVVTGDNRGGKQLGFPTANLEIDTDKLMPKQGVYAVKVFYQGKIYDGMANLGVVPTFKQERIEPKLEVYIFDFNKDIYGEELTIEWHQYIRPEKKFNGIEEIVKQLQTDEANIRKYFS